jgi:hypothetical protein
MKSTLALFLILATSMHAKAFEVDSEKKNSPIVVKITGAPGDSGGWARDEKNQARFDLSYYSRSSEFVQSCQIRYFSSAGVIVSTERSDDPAKCMALKQAMATATSASPVTVLVDRASGHILSIKSSVDYLSSAETADNLG